MVRYLSFNRTFMELKVRHTSVTNAIKACFNRTFMELKVDLNKLNLQSVKFQSHLYGIESRP